MDKETKQAYEKQYFQAHKQAIYARHKVTVAKRREQIQALCEAYKQGKSCQRCGITDSRLLEFRYKDEKTGKEGNIKNKAISMNWSEKRIQEELARCSLLCWNCRHLAEDQ